MRIEGRLGLYRVRWTRAGFSYAKLLVWRRAKFLGIPYWKAVYTTYLREGGTVSYLSASHMHRSEMEKWATEAVSLYEDWLESWS